MSGFQTLYFSKKKTLKLKKRLSCIDNRKRVKCWMNSQVVALMTRIATNQFHLAEQIRTPPSL